MKKLPLQDNKFNLFSAFLAFVIWGGWAYYINNDATSSSRAVSGLVQGCTSFTITLILIYLITWAFHKFPKKAILLPLPAMLVTFFIGGIMFFIHSFIQTPKVFYTILPSTIMTFIFCFLVTIRLKKSTEEIKVFSS